MLEDGRTAYLPLLPPSSYRHSPKPRERETDHEADHRLRHVYHEKDAHHEHSER